MSMVGDILSEQGIDMKKVVRFNPEEKGFVRVDEKVAASLNHYIQLVPQILNNCLEEGSYKVVFDKGLGALQKAASDGFFRANVVGDDGKIAGQALLQPMNQGAQMLSNAFSALSFIVGQYYMSRIDDKLGTIEERIDAIEEYLKDEKRAQLHSEEAFLNDVTKNMKFILNNDIQRQATLVSVQKIRIEAEANIHFYRSQISRMNGKIDKKDKVEDAFEHIRNIFSLISEYWLSLYSYSYALSLEPLISGDSTEEYLDNVVENISDACNAYKSDCEKWKAVLGEYIESLKALDTNKFLAELSKLADVEARGNWIVMAWQLVGIGAEKLDALDKKKKKSYRDEFEKYLSTEKLEDFSPAVEKMNNVLRYNSICNRRVEVVKYKDNIFLKASEVDKNLILQSV